MPQLNAIEAAHTALIFTDSEVPAMPVTQAWTWRLPFMQQSTLLSALRGCDGLPKRHKAKPLLKWYRRCVVYSAFDGAILTDPFTPGGGSYTGPIAELPMPVRRADGIEYLSRLDEVPYTMYEWRCNQLQRISDDFIDSRDELHGHYKEHCMHVFEVIGYKHPDETIREFWNGIFIRMVQALHLWPETCEQMDDRLGDSEQGWLARADLSTKCTD